MTARLNLFMEKLILKAFTVRHYCLSAAAAARVAAGRVECSIEQACQGFMARSGFFRTEGDQSDG
jgi:hypothetical protein